MAQRAQSRERGGSINDKDYLGLKIEPCQLKKQIFPIPHESILPRSPRPHL
jgi:hypothetical protein